MAASSPEPVFPGTAWAAPTVSWQHPARLQRWRARALMSCLFAGRERSCCPWWWWWWWWHSRAQSAYIPTPSCATAEPDVVVVVVDVAVMAPRAAPSAATTEERPVCMSSCSRRGCLVGLLLGMALAGTSSKSLRYWHCVRARESDRDVDYLTPPGTLSLGGQPPHAHCHPHHHLHRTHPVLGPPPAVARRPSLAHLLLPPSPRRSKPMHSA